MENIKLSIPDVQLRKHERNCEAVDFLVEDIFDSLPYQLQSCADIGAENERRRAEYHAQVKEANRLSKAFAVVAITAFVGSGAASLRSHTPTPFLLGGTFATLCAWISRQHKTDATTVPHPEYLPIPTSDEDAEKELKGRISSIRAFNQNHLSPSNLGPR